MKKRKNIQLLLNEILNNNQYQKMNEFVEKINNINKMLFQLKDNSDSCLKNLKLFFSRCEINLSTYTRRKTKAINTKKIKHY